MAYIPDTVNSGMITTGKARWWLREEQDGYRGIIGVINTMESQQNARKVSNLNFARMYSNADMIALTSAMYARSNLISTNSRISLNVIKSCIDTAASKIAKNKPRPLFLTNDGDWSLQQRAKKLTKFMDGVFDHIKIYDVAQRSFVDSGIFGTGFWHIFLDGKELCVERVIPDELYIDDCEAMYGKPHQIHRIKYINRDIVIEMFPEHENDILQVARASVLDAWGSVTEQIRVVESWHLPSGKNAKDGRHAITINNCTLLWEDYKKDYFPFISNKWTHKIVGFWGCGLAEELLGIQLEINKLTRTIQQAMCLVGVPQVWVENGSQVNISSMNNDMAAIRKYTGTPPIFQTPPIMAPEVYQHLENLYRKAFEITGISLLSATSQKPAGLNAAVALREYQDIQTERFQLVGQRWENCFIDSAKMIIDYMKDIGGDYKVKVADGKFMKVLSWKDVEIKDSEYCLRVFPTNILPSQPAGRLDTVQELIQGGFMGKEDAISLLDFPDLEGFTSAQTAARDIVYKMVEKMIEDGDYQQPEPYMNLQLAMEIVQNEYMKAKMQDVPEDRLELLRRFIEDCATLLQPPTMPAPMMPGQGGQVQTAIPEKPQRGELLTNAPQPAMGAAPVMQPQA